MGCECRIIPKENLHHLENYTFKNAVYTPLDIFLDRVWLEPLSKLVPKWVHPNILTLAGGLSILVVQLMVFTCVPNLESKSSPRCLSLVAGLLYLSYLTFDGIDGKHARALNLSSPIGQLLDHGVDSLITAFFSFPFLLVAPGGYNWLLSALIACSSLNLFMVNWNEIKHGFFSYSSTSLIGVSEPLVAFSVLLISHYFVPHFFHTPVLELLPRSGVFAKLHDVVSKDLTVVTAIQVLSLGFASFSISAFIFSLFKRSKCYFGTFAFLFYAFFHALVAPFACLYSPNHVLKVFCVFAASIAAIANAECLITIVSKTRPRLYHLQLVPHYLLLAHLLLLSFEDRLGLDLSVLRLSPDRYYSVLLGATVFGLLWTFLRFTKVILEIKEHLGTSFFTPSKPLPKKTQ